MARRSGPVIDFFDSFLMTILLNCCSKSSDYVFSIQRCVSPHPRISVTIPTYKFESSALAWNFNPSKAWNFQPFWSLKFQALEGLKFQNKQTPKQTTRTFGAHDEVIGWIQNQWAGRYEMLVVPMHIEGGENKLGIRVLKSFLSF